MPRTHTSTSALLPPTPTSSTPVTSTGTVLPYSPTSPPKPRLWLEPHKYTNFDIELRPCHHLRPSKPRGCKRHREPTKDDVTPEEAELTTRPVIKLKFKRPNFHKNVHANKKPVDGPPGFIPYSPESSRRESSSSYRPHVEEEFQVSTQPNPNVPPTKRARAHSGSSNLIGFYLSDDSAPSSPVDTTSPSIAHMTPSTPTVSSANVNNNAYKVHPPYISSPLASTLISGAPSHSHRATLDPSPSSFRDIEMSELGSPFIPAQLDAPNLHSQLLITRQKLFRIEAEVESLATEVNNLFKLGYGRGMGRAVSNGRGPSRLRNGAQGVRVKVEDDMEVDE
ncbi:uncharacterized protein I206_101751 [Kwoniella pini CBS 10737]|uniref:Uncharacterized protein n=1 Tax=Kwoniella pini CBS 10737 TaxID=1296096 RepID=A0A1B9HVU8_9TREE|nr:uncharacterized protein I206_06279 [Kwoniella pini CBS 10737]OCF47383.1 hypothetical protein I206_06279 [Kwoniella pini CBS 10737]